MTPRSEKGAIEKVWRVRQYLLSASAYDKTLTFEQVMGMSKAFDLLTKAQQRIGQ